ncbi:ion channel protein Tsx [Shewanella sp. AS16]|uniref:ion channel protein Tsx n=1 Tax=Shewanella sp. AS16 TaxID=2907625 RepID=UPI001F405DA3|nr:ion channel protein Tsx [Shewanella sp. AS16]MCE9687595.1 ion channel protein Tsx [Shewanella sp. AS16]
MKKTALCLALMLSPQAFADNLVQWTDFSITGLYGDDYKLAPSDEQTGFTLETAGGWQYGDWFAFQDLIYFDGNNGGQDSSTYGELSTRFSAGKILGKKITWGAITDASLALTYEEGEGPVNSLLYGLGLDFALPYFNYFSLNTYRRDAQSSGNHSDGWQFTPVFRIDFPIGNSKLVLDGFADWVFATDDDGYHSNFHFNPQLKYDLGQLIFGGHKQDKLFVGIEYDLWQNKYGVKGVDQHTYSVIAKYHF